MRKLFISSLTLIFLSSCSSELDRCVEAKKEYYAYDDINLMPTIERIEFNRKVEAYMTADLEEELLKISDQSKELTAFIIKIIMMSEQAKERHNNQLKQTDMRIAPKKPGEVEEWRNKTDPFISSVPDREFKCSIDAEKYNYRTTAISYPRPRVLYSEEIDGKKACAALKTITESYDLQEIIISKTKSIQKKVRMEMPKLICNQQGIY